MEELLDIMNQLQDVLSAAELPKFDLPQIVVVGPQSSDRSSVVEHLVGRSFMPRRPAKTECPLVLQLVNNQGNVTFEDYAIFRHNQADVFTDNKLIMKEIECQTERIDRGGKGMCSTPIFLKMYSKTFTNLTLVDLPGITKVSVGSQSEDIEKQTKYLIHEYIDNKNCIILAVIPENVGMATCESLKIAREMDPEGARTLAVVTKQDFMDQGTVGMANSISQKNVIKNLALEQSLEDEAPFYIKGYTDVFPFIEMPYLTTTIQNILISHIVQCLPKLKEQVGQKLHFQKLKQCKLGIVKSYSPTLLMDVVFKFSNDFRASINGTLGNNDTKELNGGVRLYEVFSLTNSVLEKIHPLKGLSEKDIDMALDNAFGVYVACYIPNLVFELLVKRQIKQLHSPCVKCVDIVFKELINVVYKCVNDPESQLQNYPTLKKMLSSATLDFLEIHLQTTKRLVNDIIDIHSAYINYDHTDFLPNLPKDEPPEDINVAFHYGNSSCVSVLNKIYRYFCVVRRSVMDLLPKLIMCFMVNSMMERLNSELMSRLYHMKDCDLFEESLELLQERRRINESISALERADTFLNSLKPSIRQSVIETPAKIISTSNQQVMELYKNKHENHTRVYNHYNYLLFLACLFPIMSWLYFIFQ